MTRPSPLLFVAFALLCTTNAQADVYVKQDPDGAVMLTDSPSDDGFEVIVHGEAPPLATTGGALPAEHPSARLHASRIERAARATGLDARLLHAVIRTESAYDAAAVSPKGAAGLMQLMPDTARRYGVTDRLDPDQNVMGGARYLRDLMVRFDNRLELVLAAYNAGEGAVERHGRAIPPYAETLRYVPRVMEHYRRPM